MEKELTEEKRVNGDAKLSPYWQIVNIALPNCAAGGSSDLHCTSMYGINHTHSERNGEKQGDEAIDKDGEKNGVRGRDA